MQALNYHILMYLKNQQNLATLFSLSTVDILFWIILLMPRPSFFKKKKKFLSMCHPLLSTEDPEMKNKSFLYWAIYPILMQSYHQ